MSHPESIRQYMLFGDRIVLNQGCDGCKRPLSLVHDSNQGQYFLLSRQASNQLAFPAPPLVPGHPYASHCDGTDPIVECRGLVVDGQEPPQLQFLDNGIAREVHPHFSAFMSVNLVCWKEGLRGTAKHGMSVPVDACGGHFMKLFGGEGQGGSAADGSVGFQTDIAGEKTAFRHILLSPEASGDASERPFLAWIVLSRRISPLSNEGNVSILTTEPPCTVRPGSDDGDTSWALTYPRTAALARRVLGPLARRLFEGGEDAQEADGQTDEVENSGGTDGTVGE
ncbi:unnamed protein product [Vitrella brassicaformis CCMP3155]|uniref:Uncharacterized protein n=1 Tax=Vitrella brassicaformis (strain CCMP3155) TaxID=1169540 RepID=A0A0G4G1S2_VITBC|nr:unnamed protein product [Vitrella brassicaformis CCMP3155]|eukprot:CEM21905.1 unnamed protein product [Vitrella brassicaformis CCMP3155]